MRSLHCARTFSISKSSSVYSGHFLFTIPPLRDRVRRQTRELRERNCNDFNKKHYHQPSDELRDTRDYTGAIQQAEFAM
jgi:hypothetical protein